MRLLKINLPCSRSKKTRAAVPVSQALLALPKLAGFLLLFLFAALTFSPADQTLLAESLPRLFETSIWTRRENTYLFALSTPKKLELCQLTRKSVEITLPHWEIRYQLPVRKKGNFSQRPPPRTLKQTFSAQRLEVRRLTSLEILSLKLSFKQRLLSGPTVLHLRKRAKCSSGCWWRAQSWFPGSVLEDFIILLKLQHFVVLFIFRRVSYYWRVNSQLNNKLTFILKLHSRLFQSTLFLLIAKFCYLNLSFLSYGFSEIVEFFNFIAIKLSRSH